MNIKIGVTNFSATPWTSKTMEAAMAICNYTILDCTFVLYNSAEFGDADEQGNGTEMIGAVQRGVVDTFEPYFTPTYNRMRAIDFSDPVFYTDVVMATRAPTRLKSIFNFSVLTAVKWDIWCLFISSLIILSGFIRFSTGIMLRMLGIGPGRTRRSAAYHTVHSNKCVRVARRTVSATDILHRLQHKSCRYPRERLHSMVTLNRASSCKVERLDPGQPLRPRVMRRRIPEWLTATMDEIPALITKRYKDTDLVFDFVRIAVLAWALTTTVLTCAYTGVLFSRKMQKINTLPYNDFGTMVACLERQQCRIITHSFSSSYMKILTGPENEMGRRIRATFRKRAPVIRPLSETRTTIVEDTSTYLVWIGAKNAFDQYFKENKECALYVIEAPYKEIWTFPLPKGSRFSGVLAAATVAFRENGLAEAMSTRHESRWTICDEVFYNRKLREKSDTSTAIAAMGFLASGIFVSTVAFGVEVLQGRSR